MWQRKHFSVENSDSLIFTGTPLLRNQRQVHAPQIFIKTKDSSWILLKAKRYSITKLLFMYFLFFKLYIFHLVVHTSLPSLRITSFWNLHGCYALCQVCEGPHYMHFIIESPGSSISFFSLTEWTYQIRLMAVKMGEEQGKPCSDFLT